MKITATALAATVALGALVARQEPHALPTPDPKHPMQLGAFSVSLAVKDLAASRAFYEQLGFAPIGGAPEQNWLILKNGEAVIGLFQGMFEQNILTFNPGWAGEGEHPKTFTDVRELQRVLKERGIEPVVPADPASTGPASFVLEDPDGNPVLVDQHVDKP